MTDPYSLRGLLRCATCHRLMLPVVIQDGGRAYDCGGNCHHDPMLARPVEADVLLACLVRAWVLGEEHHGAYTSSPAGRRVLITAGLSRVDVNGCGGTACYTWKHGLSDPRSRRGIESLVHDLRTDATSDAT